MVDPLIVNIKEQD